jgi:hypothetical protein
VFGTFYLDCLLLCCGFCDELLWMVRMPKYTKKPITIEAVQWTGVNINEVVDFCPSIIIRFQGGMRLMYIPTQEGIMEASIGDFIIKGIKGEFYPCKPDIFKETYDEVEKRHFGNPYN